MEHSVELLVDGSWVLIDSIPTPIPYNLNGPLAVENSQKNGLLVIGGVQFTGAQSYIFELTCPKTGCQWKLLDQKLNDPRAYHVGFLVEDSPTFECTLSSK